jgi:hypothetical protein
MKAKAEKVRYFLGSQKFFWIIFTFFIFESIWIALSAVYPQAFDENFHFGLIKIYSHYWLPFLSKQPAGGDAYGAVARDPSYLYHYLMSFPYRFIALFIHSQTGQVIALRFINIGLFAGSLVLLRRILIKVGISSSFANVMLSLFVLIPIVPQLAAQINYDNLVILLTAWVCLLTFKASDEISKREISARTLIKLLSVCIFASLVKYEFMPIFLGVVLFIFFMAVRFYRKNPKALFTRLTQSWASQTRLARSVLVIVLVIGIGLFAQRDGANLIKYHTISPDCSKVLSISACEQYSVWDYNYTSHNAILTSSQPTKFANPISYLASWVYWTWYRLFFAVNGPASQFTNYPPLPLPTAAAALITFAAVFLVIFYRKRIYRHNPYIFFLSLVCVLYIGTLITEGYLYYRYTDVLELMNGRYLLPVLIFMAAIAGSSFSIALKKSSTRKVAFALLAMLFFLQGGGFLTFITRSDNTWDWSNSTVVKVNNTARKVTNPVVVNGKETYSTKDWFFN